MSPHTGPHASFYPLSLFEIQSVFPIEPSHSLALPTFATQLLPGGALGPWQVPPGYFYASTIQRFTQVTKNEAQKAPLTYHPGANRGGEGKSCAKAARTVASRWQPCLSG